MNLMFWKKKPHAENEADGAGENLASDPQVPPSLNFVTGEQGGVAEPEPPAPESGHAEEPAEPPAGEGWAARIRSRLAALARHFKKTPAFHADETHDSPAEPERKAPEENTAESPEQETPVKLPLGVRIKLLLITVIRRFRKTPAPGAEAGSEEIAPESEAPPRPGLLRRIRAAFAAFARELKATPAPAAAEGEEAGRRSETSPEEGEPPAEETAAEPVRSRRWLVVGGSIVIVALLLTDIALTLWLSYTPEQKRWGTRHNITSISSRPPDSEAVQEKRRETAAGSSQAELEALRIRNAELQARIDTLKKTAPAQQSHGMALPRAAESSAALPSSGEMTVDTKNPKTTAMSLKEAIEAMNAATGDSGKKPPDERIPGSSGTEAHKRNP